MGHLKWSAAVFLAVTFSAQNLPAAENATGCAQLQVCFSPVLPGGCDPQRAILDTIGSAHRSVFVQAYDLTSLKIADALASAARHGVDTRVLLDPSNAMDYYERRA